MKFLVFFAFLLNVGSDTLQQQEEGAGIHSRITHGFPALPQQFPYQVGLVKWRRNIPATSGGTLISTEWVLTAAHCTIGFDIITVYLGQTMLHKAHTTIHRSSGNIIEHKDFNRTTMLDDIALIKIRPVLISPAIIPAKLPGPPPTSDYHVSGVLAGWGKTSDSLPGPSPTLQYAVFKVISNADCAATYDSESMSKGKLCTEAPAPTSGCYSDSGGALVLLGTNIPIGILSFGDKEGCEIGSPMAFTRVDEYLHWIRNNMNPRA